jgi:hypothetical protein
VYQQEQQQQEQQQQEQQDAENPFLDPPFSRIKMVVAAEVVVANVVDPGHLPRGGSLVESSIIVVPLLFSACSSGVVIETDEG